MGIQNLNKLLRDITPGVFQQTHLSEYAYKVVAIDISLYIHKYKAICGDRWLSAFLNLIGCLRRNEVHSVFIFDGKAPIEKEEERCKRRENKEKLQATFYLLEEALKEYQRTGIISKILVDLYNKRRSPSRVSLLTQNKKIDMVWVENKIEQKRHQLYEVTSEDFEIAKELFTILNVPFYTAPSEAEKFCAKLCIDGLVYAVLSEDTDVIAYQTPIFLSKIDTSNDCCVMLRNTEILEGLDLTSKQLIDLCIMCGTDYNPNIPKVGNKTAYKLIVKHGGIDEIAKETNYDVSILSHDTVRDLFIDFDKYEIEKIPFCGKPDFDKLRVFLDKHKIQANFDNLIKYFTETQLVFEDSDEEKS